MNDLASHPEPRILPAGDCAVTVEFAESIDADVNRRVIALAQALRQAAPAGVTEIVPTYRSLTLCYDPEVLRGAEIPALLRALSLQPGKEEEPARLWRLPVIYGGDETDLRDLAVAKGMSTDAIVRCHANARYRVFMIGFAPGYAYLGGLPEVLFTPRRSQPRQRVGAGALAIGGQQTSVSSVPMPSGWNILGSTPVRLFDTRRDPPFLLRAGDSVTFRPISVDEGARMRAQDAEAPLSIEPE